MTRPLWRSLFIVKQARKSVAQPPTPSGKFSGQCLTIEARHTPVSPVPDRSDEIATLLLVRVIVRCKRRNRIPHGGDRLYRLSEAQVAERCVCSRFIAARSAHGECRPSHSQSVPGVAPAGGLRPPAAAFRAVRSALAADPLRNGT